MTKMRTMTTMAFPIPRTRTTIMTVWFENLIIFRILNRQISSGIPDAEDIDDDNDGIPDVLDVGSRNANDLDGDGELLVIIIGLS